jgi:chaperonin GroES
LPESAQQKVNWGTVIEVGHGRRGEDGKLQPLTVKKGDTVMLSDWSGQTVKVNDQELFIVREDEILGTIEVEK